MTSRPFDIKIADCRVSAAARDVKPIHVETLARSIAEIGLIQPITVRPMNGKFEVIAGAHRLMAARQLGWTFIPALVCEADDLRAELALIDENLIRNELSPAERAIAITRRKTLYEALHPETRHHVAGGKKRQNSASDNLSFAESTATATGKTRRTIERDASRGRALGEDTLKKLAGTSLDKGDELDALSKLAAAAPEKAAVIIDRAAAGEQISVRTAAKQETRNARERELAGRQRDLPQKRYGVILADPEWRFEVYSRETGMDRAADNHYPTSKTDEICRRDVGSIAAEDCVLFLWATVSMLPDALQVMSAWGFSYKSHCVWDKTSQGTGYWFRNAHELLLVGTRGSIPSPAPGTQFSSVFASPAEGHSAKPDWQYELIESYFPNLPKIELNARRARPGWDAWGLEAPTCDEPFDAGTGEILTAPQNDPAVTDDAETQALPSREPEPDIDIPGFLKREKDAA